MSKRQVPYGLWPSPISPQSQAQAKRITDLAWDTTDETLLWLEGRSGFGMLVAGALDGEAPRDLTPERSVRARVGYGGGDFTAAGGYAYFISEGRIYRQPLKAGEAVPITPPFGQAASPTVSPDGRWVLFVHSDGATDCLAIVDVEGRFWPQRLVGGDDFYMQPIWHPSGAQVAWISWCHPQMPWDGTRLSLGYLASSQGGLPILHEQEGLAGGADISIFQPTFSPDGRYLAYVSDASGWYNLYLYDLAQRTHRPLTEDEAEWGLAAWVQGLRTYAWAPDGRTIYACRESEAAISLWRLDVETGAREQIALGPEYAWVEQPAVSPRGALAVIASGPRVPKRLLVLDPVTGESHCLARSASETVPLEALSVPQSVQWVAEGGQPVYGLYYPPASALYEGSGKPPLIVQVHGGPTSQSTQTYSASSQFFATRGYAVLDVNYRGSTGYGRAYRNLLRGNWGIYDADDAVAGARFLCERGLADPDRMVIMGGSAGGYTVLQALIRYPHTFKAGICSFGVTNLFTLAAETHKFEQRYLDSLIGPLPEDAALYRERSPLFHARHIVDAVAVFQGEEDQVVPRNQADTLVEALRQNGVPHIYRLYPGEGHGWRKAETISAFYEEILRFLRDYVLFA